MVNHGSSHEGDITGLKGLTKRAMNWMSGNRTISIQEAVHEIEELPLVLCSERLLPVYINGFMSIKRESQPNPTDCLSRYAHRKEHMDMSLHRYFYQKYVPYIDRKIQNKEFYKQPILNSLGMNCRAVHPITFDYARGLLILYKPWSKASYLDFRDKEKIIDMAKKMLLERLVPYNVYAEYYRAQNKNKQLDLISKERNGDLDELLKDVEDPEYLEQNIQAMNARQFTNTISENDEINSGNVDIGLNHDWSSSFFKGIRDTRISGEDYIDWAKNETLNNER